MRKGFRIALLIGLVHLFTDAGYAQVETEKYIRTWVIPINNWNMEDNQFWNSNVSVPAGLSNEKIVGITVLIYSDEGETTEVFNLTRTANHRSLYLPNNTNSPRGGGWSNISIYSNGTMNIVLDRGDCIKGSTGECAGVEVQSFFAAKSQLGNSTTFPNALKRVFKSNTKVRGKIKIDYICTSCSPSSPPATNVLWRKLGPWDMVNGGEPHINHNTELLSPISIVDLSATIHSDYGTVTLNDQSSEDDGMPLGANAIIVDDFESQGNRNLSPALGPPVFTRAKGGFLWLGFGCNIEKNSAQGLNLIGCKSDAGAPHEYQFKFFAGPIESAGIGPGRYRAEATNLIDKHMNVSYSRTGIQNRGWLRVEYTGAKSSIKSPYAVKSMAIQLGAWDMSLESGKALDLSSYKVSANRVLRMMTTIHSNSLPSSNGNYRIVSNFNRIRSGTGSVGLSKDSEKAGGGALIHEYERFEHLPDSGLKREALFQRGAYDLSVNPDYYSRVGSPPAYTGTSNRGHLLIDYLAGSCDQGPSGFKIKAIPGTQIGDCDGNASTFSMEGSGADIWGPHDDFTYAYTTPPQGAVGTDVEVRIEAHQANSDWAKTGIMFRGGLETNAAHVSLLMSRSHGIDLHFRPVGQNQSTTRKFITNSFSAPYYIRLEKNGNNFTAYARQAGDANWVTIATHSEPNFPSSYYYGLAQSSHDDPKLAKSIFNSFNAFHMIPGGSGSSGLHYGTVSGNINTTSSNPKTSITTSLNETEGSIAGNTTKIFTGAIYDADGNISFTEDIDDKTRLYIDGTIRLTSDNWNDRVSTGNLNLSPGWHTFELRISNGSGGSGPRTSPGFGFDPNGGTNWVHPSDPGNGSLFRTAIPSGGGGGGPQTGVPYSVKYEHSGKCLGVVGGSGANGANIEQQTCNGSNHQKLTLNQEPGGFYSLRFQHSNQMVDIEGANSANGASALQWPYHGNDNQLFSLINHGNGTYSFRYKHSNRCVDVNGEQSSDGANVIQWDCHYNPNQRFRFQ